MSVALAIKRLFDICISVAMIIACLPIWLVISIAILWDDGCPVVFRRRVVGKGGGYFDAFKFRTMVKNADEILQGNVSMRREFEERFKLKNDPRVTRIGRFLRKASLDETPQLINVVIGQMSLVGPRMISGPEVARFGSYAYKLFTVKPGLAGAWAAAGRQNLSYHDRIRIEIEYIDSWSLWLDLKLLAKTVIMVFSTRGAH